MQRDLQKSADATRPLHNSFSLLPFFLNYNRYYDYRETDKEIGGVIARPERHGLDPKEVMLDALKKLSK